MTPGDVDALVLAGGLGLRARSYLGDTPKILAPVGGRPLLDYLLHYLQVQGVRRVILSLGHGSAAVRERLLLPRAPSLTIDVLTVVDDHDPPLGQAAAIHQAMPLVASDRGLLVLNGDTLTNLDLATFLNRVAATGASHVTAVNENRTSLGVHFLARSRARSIIEWPATGIPYVTSADFLDVGTPEGYADASAGSIKRFLR